VQPASPARAVLHAVLAAVTLAAPTRPARGAGAETHRHSSEHYEIETTISPEFAEVVGRHMEAIYREYSRRFEKYGEVERKFQVTVFRSERDYLERVPSTVTGSCGVFMARDGLLAAHAEGRTGEEVLRTLYHEGFHQFMFEVINRDCPIWLNEGLAEYFALSRFSGGRLELGRIDIRSRVWSNRGNLTYSTLAINGSAFTRIYYLQNHFFHGGRVQLDSLLGSAGRSGFLGGSVERKYAMSWLLVHFLLHGKDGSYREPFMRYMRDEIRGDGSLDRLLEELGADLERLEREFRAYVMRK